MNQNEAGVRKRILMFYFAAGVNLVMAVWVLSVGAGRVAGGTLGLISLVFLVFAYLNFRFARALRRRWEEQVRQQQAMRSAHAESVQGVQE